MLRFSITVLGLAVLWILFVAGTKPEEMIVGLVCVSLTVWFVYYVARNECPRIKLNIADWIQVWRVPGYLLIDSWSILRVLALDILRVSPAPSLFRATRFDSPRDPEVATGRRVLAVVYTSATPNMIVLGIDTHSKQMLFHQLQRTEIPAMTRNLGARA